MKTSRVVLLLLLFIATICLFVSCKNEPPEVKHYSVCFYFLDEGCAYSYQTVEAGKKAVRPEDPTKAEFVFDNWYRDTSLTQVYDFNSPVNSDMTLYTKWKVAEKYSVTYNGNGATSGTAPIDSNSPYFSGSTVHVLGKGDLAHSLKSFAGWNTASDGSGTDYVTRQSFVITGNIVFYAKWSDKSPGPAAPVIPSTSIWCPSSETSIDGSIFSDVDETMEYSTDGGTTWVPVTWVPITSLSAGIVKVRVKETDTTLAGEITDVDLRCVNASDPSALALAYVAPTTIGGSDGKITGVSTGTAMEYSTDGGSTWTPCTGTEITGLSAGDVKIRYSATDKRKASVETTITVEDMVTITFNGGNGGTGSMASVLKQKGTSYTLPASTFTAPTGKSFSKWKVQGSDTEYSVGDSFTVSSDITLVAQWSDKASGPEAPTGITRSVSPSDTSTADGVISGVNTTMQYSTDNGATWNDCTGTTITGLKAGKVKIRVKETETTLAGNILEFYLKVEGSKISAPTGLTPTAPTTAGGSDGKITGVSTAMEYSTDGGEHWNNCGTEITGLSAGTVKVRLKETDITEAGLIAEVVVKARYSISFAAGEHGNSTMTAASAVAGESYTVPACGFTADTGYEFAVWHDGTTDVEAGSSIIVNSNITLTAKWNPKTYTITYKDKGNVAFSGEHETGYPTTHTYGTATTLKTATKTGYTFGGWFVASDCSGSAITSLGATSYSDTITLYAKWNPETYTITYKDKDGANFSGTHESGYPETHTYGTATTLKTATKTGYTFGGWFVASDCSGSAITNLGATAYLDTITLYAKWSDKASGPTAPVIPSTSIRCATSETSTDASISDVDETMEYSTDGGTTWIPVMGTQITGLSAGIVKVRVKETDTTLAGEITDVDLRCENTSVPSGMNYVAPTTIDGSDGKITGVSTAMEYSTDNGITWTACTGTEITGLSSGDVQIRYAATDKKKASTPTTITVEDKVTITFNGNGATGNMTSVLIQKGTSYTVPACGFTANTGYEFNIWNDGTSDIAVNSVITVNSNITLTAKWNPKTYTITYKDKGNADFSGIHESGYPQTHTYGTATTLKTATKTGYVFGGWFVASDCSGSAVKSLGATSYSDTITLYAKWDVPIAKLVSGSSFNTKLKNKMNGTSIDELVFRTGQAAPTTIADSDLMSTSDSVCKAWLSTEETTLYVNTDCTEFVTDSCVSLFSRLSNLKSIDMSRVDTSQVTDMRSMFNSCSSLTELDLSGFNTSQVTDMGSMFYNCSSLTTLDVSELDTSQVTDMRSMFDSCSSLTELDLSGFNTSQVTDMGSMFSDCSSLTELDLSGFNTSQVTDMGFMFDSCSSLTELDLSGFNTSQVTNMGSMFSGCSSLTELDVSGFNTSQVTRMRNMFCGCRGLTELDVSGFNTSQVTDMSYMFDECFGLTALNVSGIDTSKVTSMSYMFYKCSGLTELGVSGFSTSQVTNMASMFYGCSGLTELDVSDFSTSQVTNMDSMFYGCSKLAELDVLGFNTSKVTNTRDMFCDCSSLTELDVSGFDTSQVKSMYGMFSGCESLATLDVSGFGTSQVKDMFGMFNGCSGLTELDLSGFDTTQVTVMSYMFSGCSGLKTLKTGYDFSVENVTGRTGIFSDFATSAGEHTVVVPNTATMAAFYGDGDNGWIRTGWTQDGINLKKII